MCLKGLCITQSQIAALSATLLVTANLSCTPKYNPDSLGTPISTSDLRSSLERTIAENQCESQGIQRIVESVKSSNFETMWVYIPEAESPTKCQWIEIGQGEYGGDAAAAIVKVKRGYLAKLMAAHTQLHLYHSHPLDYFEQCEDTNSCGEFSVPMTTDKLSEKGLISNLRYSMPSPNDVAFMMEVTREFEEHRADGGKIRNRVVTPYGIVDYSLTEEGKRRLRKVGMEGKEGRWGFDTYIRTRLSYGLTDGDLRSNIHTNPGDITRALEQLAESLSNRYLQLTYTPF